MPVPSVPASWRPYLEPLRPAVRAVRWCQGYWRFLRDYRRFRRLDTKPRFPVQWRHRLPILSDWTAQTAFDRHYIYHPAWAARIVARLQPRLHVDISSTLAFCTVVSAFVPVDFYDYRPADLQLSGLASRRGDLLALPFPDGAVESLSCMHVVEHVGLGRYGDPVDPDGDVKAMAELKRVLAPGGSLLLVTPVGRSRVMFNAHRVYATRQILDAFAGLTVRDFSLIPDPADGPGLIENADYALADRQTYGCGCFWFQRPGGSAAGDL
jgi:SAM-dependent methyltransferase